jgi:hypothetical protein
LPYDVERVVPLAKRAQVFAGPPVCVTDCPGRARDLVARREDLRRRPGSRCPRQPAAGSERPAFLDERLEPRSALSARDRGWRPTWHRLPAQRRASRHWRAGGGGDRERARQKPSAILPQFRVARHFISRVMGAISLFSIGYFPGTRGLRV